MQKKIISILTRFCSLAFVFINIQKSPSFLVALFAVCCIIFIKKPLQSVLYPGHRLIAGGCIIIEPPCVFSTIFVYFSWISLFFSAVSGRSSIFATGNLCRKIRAISKCNQFSCPCWKNPSRNVNFCREGMLYKIHHLWRKIVVDTLYFSANSWLTTPGILPVKIKTSTYPSPS